ncbi:2-keto-4-pentenoate hydratase [Jiangella mangrovi]|uniref:2-keto-4-pentenoate hydratase n=1 Tax=Jiangella mangrovi TaxID=1524084 RepID=A0A7W9GM82_9ACTN|nr:fumarylacetoacetate hydrolase family protein [Jiangella mangrovi]MBB5786126.1 2-keto-4-pentenoate hydratase [Jiangella mangrovi]
MSASTAVEEAAARLRGAEHSRTPCAPVRDLIGADDVEAAYAVQAVNLRRRYDAGRVRVGRKIGLTSPAVQRQLGVDSPDFGALLDDMVVPDGGAVPAGRLLQPKVEAEVAFWLAADIDAEVADPRELRDAVEAVGAAIEVVDSRIAGWDITLGDTVADNASSGMFVVSGTRVPLTEVEPAGVVMSLTRDGDGAVVSEGTGAACLGDPLAALAWLAAAAMRFGDPLRAGEVVLSGALGPMVAASPGDRFTAGISGLGPVSVSFADRED